MISLGALLDASRNEKLIVKVGRDGWFLAANVKVVYDDGVDFIVKFTVRPRHQTKGIITSIDGNGSGRDFAILPDQPFADGDPS
jgi:hypothetical protein